MGVRDPDLLARACDLGVAMQLSNIARDVGEDAVNGRLYLPREWLREEGLDPDAWLANPVWSPALGRVVSRLLEAAEALYTRADQGIGGLPLHCRAGIGAARHLYAEIGHEVGRRGMNSVGSRAVVSPRRKAQLLPRVLFAALPRRPVPLAALAETSFLVEAVKAQPLGQSINPQGVLTPTRPIQVDQPATVASRVLFVADLFQRLEERDRERRLQYTGMRSSLSGVSID
jgi:phytoene synthase